MSYQVFARKYRPRTFEDVLGQDHVVRTLRNAIEKDRIAQAYLFVGPRGTGKTSTARILAKALNCPDGPKIDFDPDAPICQEIAEGRSLDVLEIDGASNNGVEQVRELRETVQYAPAQGRYKIYYIDEVHMLSNAAFNALLKTLEEPPPHVKFIFATTEPHKILPTIISRCQRFDLRRIPDEIIASHLLHIAQAENIKLADTAASAIARGAEGGMRDAQSMLDQLVAFCGDAIAERDVEEIFGITSWETVAALADQLLNQQSAQALNKVREHHEAGHDLQRLLGDLIRHWRNLIVWQIDGGESLTGLGKTQAETIAHQATLADTDHLLLAADELASTLDKLRWASDQRLQFDLGLVRTIRALESVSLENVLTFLEKQGANPDQAPPTQSQTQSQTAPPTPTPQPAPTPKPEPTQKPEPTPTQKAEPEPEPTPGPETNSTPEPEPKPTPEPEPLTFDGPVRNPLPEPPEDQDPPEEEPYDDTNDYGGSLLDALSAQIPVAPPRGTRQPTPPPEPDPEPPKEPSEPIQIVPLDDLAHFWESVTSTLPEHLGMVAEAASSGHPLKLESGTLHIGLPPSQKFSLDSFLKNSIKELSAHASAVADQPLALKFTIDQTVPEPELPIPEIPSSEPAKKSAPEKPEPKPQAPNPADQFADDPAIERALSIFEAEVLES